MSDDLAIIGTLDFFPPLVDDPRTFGEIAAANALSDVFAMGGRVLFALSIAAFPEALPREVMTEIFAGASSKVREAGGTLAGGHTIRDPEPKYGLAVIGAAHPDRLLRKGGARPGDRLLLTKPLGTGVLVSGARQGRTSGADLATAIEGMRRLNRAASQALVASGVRTATDVTGFGLLGHGLEMARAPGPASSSRRPGCRRSPGRLTWPRRASRRTARATTAATSRDRSTSRRGSRASASRWPTTRRPPVGCWRPCRPTWSRASSARSMTQASSAGGSAASRPVSQGSRWRPEASSGVRNRRQSPGRL